MNAKNIVYYSALAFTQIELIAVIGIITVISGLTVPAVVGLTSSTALNTGTSQLADFLSLARSEAIARHTVVRFAVASESENDPERELRQFALWAWDPESHRYFQISHWESLPKGVILEPGRPEYLKTAAYASQDGSLVRGDSVLGTPFSESAEFTEGPEGERLSMRYVEFLPSGAVRIPGGTARQAIFVATHGSRGAGGSISYVARHEGRPSNWAQVNVDTLTGRVHVHRP
jgi:hypothetical protein